MSPQLTLQTPLQLPPTEIPTYLEQLWSHDEQGDKGANTFCLIVWQPAWIEQKLVKTGKISGPVVGSQRNDLIEAAILDGADRWQQFRFIVFPFLLPTISVLSLMSIINL